MSYCFQLDCRVYQFFEWVCRNERTHINQFQNAVCHRATAHEKIYRLPEPLTREEGRILSCVIERREWICRQTIRIKIVRRIRTNSVDAIATRARIFSDLFEPD